ncbi:MAG: DUF357 domain-containing protein [Candidatus Pacearchaeota archaeon]
MKSKKINKVLKNRITKNKLQKYLEITFKALEIAKKSYSDENEKKAKEILKMVECYLSDATYFKENKDYINAFASVNYAHGWLDSGARLKIFDVKDDKLFTI